MKMRFKPHKQGRLEKRFLGSWWVVGWCLLCFAAFEQGKAVSSKQEGELQARILQLRSEIERLDLIQGELELELASIDDPAWIELSLIRALGVCPDGEQMIYFPIKEPVAR